MYPWHKTLHSLARNFFTLCFRVIEDKEVFPRDLTGPLQKNIQVYSSPSGLQTTPSKAPVSSHDHSPPPEYPLSQITERVGPLES